jgi:hypothetical protein
MFILHFMHGLGTKSAEYLDMTSRGVFVHCTVEEGNSILDRILSVTPLEDLQIKAPLSRHLSYLSLTGKGRIASTHCSRNRLKKQN